MKRNLADKSLRSLGNPKKPNITLMKKTFCIALMVLFIMAPQTNVFGQTETQENQLNQKYLLLSIGWTRTTFRDFATSPLFYRGSGFSLSYEKQIIDQKSEINWGFSPLFSSTEACIAKSDYIQERAVSAFISMDGYLKYYRDLPRISSEKIQFKAGGTVLATQNIRINESLLNSAFGVETFLNLMLSAKADIDISQKEEKTIHLWFLKIKQNPSKQKLSFQTDIGLLNFNHRPSYNYVYFDEIDDNYTNELFALKEHYDWSLNGYRFGTKIEYSKFASTGNGFKIAYIWDMTNAPGKHQTFQMATHRIQYTLIINKNK